MTVLTAGTNHGPAPTSAGVRCDRYREAASARLDGEPIGMSAAALDDHLASCPDCARWWERATQATRSLRLQQADVPDLSARILADSVLPARGVLRRRALLRLSLVVVGIVQVGLAVPAIFGGSIDMAMSMHAAHEAAAWNLALGTAFVATALVPRRAPGVLLVLSGFVAVLTLLSIRDLAGGVVAAGRVATHAAVVVGLVLLFVLDRVERALPQPRTPAAVEGDADDEAGGLRTVA